MNKRAKHCKFHEEDDQEDMQMPGNIKDSIWQSALSNKHIIINGVINEQLIERAVYQVLAINEFDDIQESTYVGYERTPIKIYINSSGGTLDEAMALIAVIETSKTPVETCVLGKAYSAGFLILLAGHYRTATHRSRGMLHQGSSGINADFSTAIAYAKHWKKMQKEVDTYILEKTAIKKKKLKQIFEHSEDFYMNSEQLYKLGCIDDIIGITDQEENKSE